MTKLNPMKQKKKITPPVSVIHLRGERKWVYMNNAMNNTVEQYFSANKQYFFPLTTNQHKPNFSEANRFWLSPLAMYVGVYPIAITLLTFYHFEIDRLLYAKALFGCICIHFDPHVLEWIGMELSLIPLIHINTYGLR
jgi:hypothetical protein